MKEQVQKENQGHEHGIDHGHKKEVSIIVNGTSHPFDEKEISFKQVIILAYGTFEPDRHSYTVTYKMGQGNKPGGNLVFGSSVKVKPRLIFNVSRAIKS